MPAASRTLAAAIAAAAAFASVLPAHAQSMVPAQGAGSVSVGYQTGLINKHLLRDRSVGGVRIQSHAIMVDFTIGLGKNFGLGVALPFVTAILPSHNYEFLSHAAPGRRVRELRVGVAMHRLLTPLSAKSYVHAHAAHAFQQEIAGVPRRATHLNVETGYFLRPDLSVFGGLVFHVTHGGIDLIGNPRVDYSGPLFINHDRISRERMLNAGGGLAYSISDRNSLSASVSRTLSGINGHAQAFVLNIAFTRSFGGTHGH